MKISGFTFIKDALIYDYPIVEAIQSILPICDEVVVAVGKSCDATLALIQNIDSPKIKIIKTVWDESLREGGRVLAMETNKAFQNISEDSDWAFYIQGDEVMPERYLDEVHSKMLQYKDEKKVEGLLFNYLHFYGSYDYVGSSVNWYPKEVRVIRNDKSIFSFGDAQSFRKGEKAKKIRVRPTNAYMYHYGWVRKPEAMQEKQENFNKYWHDNQWLEENIVKKELYDYAETTLKLKRFEGEHPNLMKERIAATNWKFDYDISCSKMSLKHKFKEFLEDNFGIIIGRKHYKIVKL